jgi:flagellar motor switch protein FliG
MTQLSPSLRKAAVLISALDERSADALLTQMGAEQAAKVRSALMELDDIPADEQQQVLAEFFRRSGSRSAALDDDVSLEISQAAQAKAVQISADYDAGDNLRAAATPAGPIDPPSFAFLDHIDPRALALALSREQPQTVAVVVVELSPERAAALLENLPADLATETLERTAWLGDVAPEIKAELAQALRRQLAPHIRQSPSGTRPLAHVSAVLSAMGNAHRERLADKLAERDATLAEHLRQEAAHARRVAGSSAAANDAIVALRYRLESPARPVNARTEHALPSAPSEVEQPWLDFEDLLLLDDAALRTVFAETDPEVALLALTGAEARLIARIARKLPQAQAAAFRQRLERPGPVRLREIEQARSALAAVASRLAHEGEITLPATIRFTAAI